MVNLQDFNIMNARANAIKGGNYYKSEHERLAA